LLKQWGLALVRVGFEGQPINGQVLLANGFFVGSTNTNLPPAPSPAYAIFPYAIFAYAIFAYAIFQCLQ